MANEHVFNLVFNFRNRKFANVKLAQALNSSLSVFRNTVCEHFEPAVNDDKCPPYVDDIGIRANSTNGILNNFDNVLQKFLQAVLKLTMSKC